MVHIALPHVLPSQQQEWREQITGRLRSVRRVFQSKRASGQYTTSTEASWWVTPRTIGCRSSKRYRISEVSVAARLQRPRDRFSDITADERFAEHIDDACRLRAFAQLRATVAAHEYDRDLWPQLPDLARQLGPREVGHRLVGQHEIEALRVRAKRLQRGFARIKPHRQDARIALEIRGKVVRET